jgi:DNA polymerase iota
LICRLLILRANCTQDYDCFYASVFENENPSLRPLPLGIKQKSILATCNYVARARGVKKLMLISEAQRVCPDLVLLNGEDLTRFRTASKRLWSFLRAHSWNGRVERLGLDEVFLDVTDIVAYNRELLNPHALANSFFQLDRADPVKGFAFDGSRFYGCVEPPSLPPGQNEEKGRGSRGGLGIGVSIEGSHCVALLLASHLARYLRHKLDEDFGYTSSGGISINKVLAKLVGSVHKPNEQTTLLTIADGAVQTFMDAHTLRKVPGIGSRTAQAIEEYVLSQPTARRDREGSLTVGEVRRHPGMSSELLEQILDRPGAERGGGEKVWALLHGVDPSEVKEASDVPTQISIEDTYMSRPLQTPAEIARELRALATSLIGRMRVDLTDADGVNSITQHTTTSKSPKTCTSPRTPRWLAYPKTLRLSTRTKPKPGTTNTNETSAFSRSSRSAPLPSFVFNISAAAASAPRPPSTSHSLSPSSEALAERLVTESLLPLFRRLHPERGGGWNLALINICVTNMIVVAIDADAAVDGKRTTAAGRDIGSMFRTQEDKLRQWTVYDTTSTSRPSQVPTTTNLPTTASNSCTAFLHDSRDRSNPTGQIGPIENTEEEEERKGKEKENREALEVEEDVYDDSWEEEEQQQEHEPDVQRCEVCGHVIPSFALPAHERFHAMGEYQSH